jgi:hypothetical protein
VPASGVERFEGNFPDLLAVAVAGYDIRNPMTVVRPDDIEQAGSALNFDGISHQWNVHRGRYVTSDFDLSEGKFVIGITSCVYGSCSRWKTGPSCVQGVTSRRDCGPKNPI